MKKNLFLLCFVIASMCLCIGCTKEENVIKDNEVKESTIMNQKSLPSEITNIQFTDYTIASFYSGQGLFRNRMASTTSQEIIFYGKEGENVYFYYKFLNLFLNYYWKRHQRWNPLSLLIHPPIP